MNFSAPHAHGSETSQAAAESVVGSINRLERLVLNALESAGSLGLTRDELELRTGLAGNCVRPRVWTLMRRGLIADSGRQRRTATGRQAAVLIFTGTPSS